jgi:hypothetical protein
MPLAGVSLAVLTVNPAQAALEVTASRSLTIQPGGPRSNENGTRYYSIEGKGSDEHPSFDVLIFGVPKEMQDKKVKSVTLTLVQSIPRFAKDGAIRFYSAPNLNGAVRPEFQ